MAVAVLAASALLAVFLRRPPSPVERAQKVVASDARFATAHESGFALLKVAQLLRQQAESCRGHDPTSQDCADLFAGTAYAQVSAVSVLQCTRPDVFDTRERMRTYLAQLRKGAHPQVPQVVTCA